MQPRQMRQRFDQAHDRQLHGNRPTPRSRRRASSGPRCQRPAPHPRGRAVRLSSAAPRVSPEDSPATRPITSGSDMLAQPRPSAHQAARGGIDEAQQRLHFGMLAGQLAELHDGIGKLQLRAVQDAIRRAQVADLFGREAAPLEAFGVDRVADRPDCPRSSRTAAGRGSGSHRRPRTRARRPCRTGEWPTGRPAAPSRRSAHDRPWSRSWPGSPCLPMSQSCATCE